MMKTTFFILLSSFYYAISENLLCRQKIDFQPKNYNGPIYKGPSGKKGEKGLKGDDGDTGETNLSSLQGELSKNFVESAAQGRTSTVISETSLKD